MTELKPCPFCGGEAKMFSAKVNTFDRYVVYCQKCDASSHAFFLQNDAADAWNRMVDDAEIH